MSQVETEECVVYDSSDDLFNDMEMDKLLTEMESSATSATTPTKSVKPLVDDRHKSPKKNDHWIDDLMSNLQNGVCLISHVPI